MDDSSQSKAKASVNGSFSSSVAQYVYPRNDELRVSPQKRPRLISDQALNSDIDLGTLPDDLKAAEFEDRVLGNSFEVGKTAQPLNRLSF